jgi:hypothetical protein
MELEAHSPATQPSRLMAAITYVCSVAHVARLLGEDAELLEAIVSNADNMTYGNIVSVHIAHEDYITALTDDGVQEIKDMLTWARVSKDTWQNFLEDFVGDPEIIARVKDQSPR